MPLPNFLQNSLIINKIFKIRMDFPTSHYMDEN